MEWEKKNRQNKMKKKYDILIEAFSSKKKTTKKI